MNTQQSFKKRYLFLMVAIVLLVLARIFPLGSYLNVEFFAKHKGAIQSVIEQHYEFCVALFIILYSGVVVAMLPLTLVLNVIAGYFFGAGPALIYTVVGAAVGSALLFIYVRYCFKDVFMQRYGSRLGAFRKEIDTWGFYYILFLELLPLTPFTLIIILAALSDLGLNSFIVATVLGIIPGTLVYVMAGSKMSAATSIREIMNWQMILILILLAIVSLIPVIFKRLRARKNVAS